MAENSVLQVKELAEAAGLVDRGYLKDYLDKPLDRETATAILKKLDGAEKLIGTRPAVPARDAKPEDLIKFFEGYRPEKADEYEIPLEKDAKVDEGYLKAVRDALHAGRISKAQAAEFFKVIGAWGAGQRKAQAEARARSDAEFDALAKAALGEKNKEVMERVRKAIAEHAPAAYKGQLDKIDDKNLVLMAGVIDAIMQKYVPEDQLKGKPPAGGGATGGTAKEKRDELAKLIGSKSYSDWQATDHEQVLARVKALSREIADLEAGK